MTVPGAADARETAGALPVVDGLDLPDELRALLRPGEPVAVGEGRKVALPRWLYEIDSWETARRTMLAPYFGLYELIAVDVREAAPLRRFPRHVPLALAHLASHLPLALRAGADPRHRRRPPAPRRPLLAAGRHARLVGGRPELVQRGCGYNRAIATRLIAQHEGDAG